MSLAIFSGCKMPKTGWAQSGTLVTGSESTAVSCQAEFGDGSIYTVQFGVTTPTVGMVIRPQADLIMTANGNDVRRRISIVNGSSFSGTSNVVKVIVRDRLTAAMPGILGLPYTVNIQISKGVRPATPNPPYLVPDVYIDGAGVVIPYVGVIPIPAVVGDVQIPVPENSGVTSVLIKAITPIIPTPPLHLTAIQESGGTGLSEYDPRDYNFVPLWPSTERIRIQNRSAIDGFRTSILFGVDG